MKLSPCHGSPFVCAGAVNIMDDLFLDELPWELYPQQNKKQNTMGSCSNVGAHCVPCRNAACTRLGDSRQAALTCKQDTMKRFSVQYKGFRCVWSSPAIYPQPTYRSVGFVITQVVMNSMSYGQPTLPSSTILFRHVCCQDAFVQVPVRPKRRGATRQRSHTSNYSNCKNDAQISCFSSSVSMFRCHGVPPVSRSRSTTEKKHLTLISRSLNVVISQ